MADNNNNSTSPTAAYLPAYRFLLDFDNAVVGSFKSVSGIGNKQDVIEFKLGGDKSVRRKPGRVTFNNIVLERGFSQNDDLAKWRQEIIDGTDARRSGAVVFLNREGAEEARYNFFRAWPVSWEGPGLTAGSSDTAIEKVELAIEWAELKKS